MVAISGLVQVMGTRSRLFRTIPSTLQDPQASFPEKTAPHPSTTAQARSPSLHTSTIRINIHYLWPGLFYVLSSPLVDTLQICKSEPHHSFPTLTAMSSYSVGSPTKSSALKLLPSKALLFLLLDNATPIASRPCSLVHDVIARKTINPRSYSAITGHRNLDLSVIHSSDEVSEPGNPELFAEVLAAQGVVEGVRERLRCLRYCQTFPGEGRRRIASWLAAGDQDSDCYCLVMLRFGDNKDLFKHIELAPDGLLTAEVRRIFGQIVDGVAFLHKRNIVHWYPRQE
ncbi:hypothetical protein PtA15_13A444 [Puccinia triticina]|uniref:Protein kinase domain-containing protein n=1 Tax=Puccinia triticina TaxID=208348 RepID=A0ABY7D2H5_9BASI|nr:uncharacterized protein PtA15_13A444 [Puccinia triticina]WAQ91044.1 hypothetical protein PtA15_13A444 [Puccinia triticina]